MLCLRPRYLNHISRIKRYWHYYAADPVIHNNGVAVLKLDAKESKVNTLNPALQEETTKIWKDFIEPRKNDIKSVVFMSAKPDNFIAGADVSEICINLWHPHFRKCGIIGTRTFV